MLDLAFQPDRASREPVYRQLEAFLRELIDARRLLPAERLPASRELASSLGLSRNTVNLAYQQLVDDGLLSAHVGRGTFVTADRGPAGARAEPAAGQAPRGIVWRGLLARRTRAVRVPDALRDDPPGGSVRFDFRGGRVDPASLPRTPLARAYARVLARQLPALAEHRDPAGWPPLREAIARLLVSRGMRCQADDVLVTSGAQQGLDLLARVLVDPGDAVALEQPGYFGASLAFSGCEAHLIGVEVDREGLRTDALARVLRTRRVKLVFATPAVQSPTGATLSAQRRRELLALADEYQLPIVEDDYDSELRYGSPPQPALRTLDTAGRVVYLGTFSKALFAGLRVGYVVAPQPLLRRLLVSRWAADFQSDVVAQAALAELLGDGSFERHVRRVRKLYAQRRQVMLDALDRHMPEGVRFAPPAGGSGVWLTLPSATDPASLLLAARAADVAYSRGDLYHHDGTGSGSLLLSFAGLSAARIEEGVARLAALVRRARRRKR